MRKRLHRYFFIGILFAASPLSSLAISAVNAQSPKNVLKARVSATQALDEYGVEVESNSLPTKIVAIRLGTAAAQTGFRVGDEIQRFETKGRDVLILTVKRNQKIYQATLRQERLLEESISQDGFWSAPSNRDQLIVEPQTKEATGLYVAASMVFCTADDNPNWHWLEQEIRDPQLRKEWRLWTSRIQSLTFNSLLSSKAVDRPEARFHVAIRCDRPSTAPVVEITVDPTQPLRQQRAAAVGSLLPLLRSISPQFGNFPAKTKTKLVHLMLTVKRL
jgi:hypothetical protein